MIVKNKCACCGNVFTAGRIDAKTCSAKCRNKLNRDKLRRIVSENVLKIKCDECSKTFKRNEVTVTRVKVPKSLQINGYVTAIRCSKCESASKKEAYNILSVLEPEYYKSKVAKK